MDLQERVSKLQEKLDLQEKRITNLVNRYHELYTLGD